MWWNVSQHKAVRNTSICPDYGASSFYNTCTVKGPIATIPEIPGLAVWRSGHIGIYIGNGKIVESKGRKYGVVYSDLAGTTFTNWGKLSMVQYINGEEIAPVPLEGYAATINTKYDTGLSIWSDTKKSKALKTVPKGAQVLVIEDYGSTATGWVKAEYQGVIGYIDKQYLVRVETEEKKEDVLTIPNVTLKNGSKGNDVKTLQTYLNLLQYNAGTIDGIFGSKTEAAVKAFQNDSALKVDGIVAKQTWTALIDQLEKQNNPDNDSEDEVPRAEIVVSANDTANEIIISCGDSANYNTILGLINEYLEGAK